MPNFVVSTICFGPEADACEVLDFAIRHGFQGIELSSYHFWPERLRADEVERLRAGIAQHGMRLAIHARHRGISFGAHDATLRRGFVEELQATIRFAAELGLAGVQDAWAASRPVEEQRLLGQAMERHALEGGCVVYASRQKIREPLWATNSSDHRASITTELNSAIEAARRMQARCVIMLSGALPNVPVALQFAALVEKVPRLRRFPVSGFFFREYRR